MLYGRYLVRFWTLEHPKTLQTTSNHTWQKYSKREKNSAHVKLIRHPPYTIPEIKIRKIERERFFMINIIHTFLAIDLQK